MGDEEQRNKLIEKLALATNKQAANVSDEIAETLNTVMEGDQTGFASMTYPESVEYYAPYIHSKFATLLDYVPSNALLAFDEWDSVMASLNTYHEKLEKSYAEGVETGRLLSLPHRLHLNISDCTEILKSKLRLFFTSIADLAQANIKTKMDQPEPVLELDDALAAKRAQARDSSGFVSAQNLVQFDCQPVEHFNNQIKAAVEKIRHWQSNGLAVLINSEQPQRVMDLLQEWDCSVFYLGATESSNIEDTANTFKENAHAVAVSRHWFFAWICSFRYCFGCDN